MNDKISCPRTKIVNNVVPFFDCVHDYYSDHLGHQHHYESENGPIVNDYDDPRRNDHVDQLVSYDVLG